MSRGISNLGGGGGLTQEEHDALMSIASMPARGDFNPNKESSTGTNFTISFRADGNASLCLSAVPCSGYDKLAFYHNYTASSITLYWGRADGTRYEAFSTPAKNVWSDYNDVPSDAVSLVIRTYVSGVTAYAANGSVSMLTADSPYNPDNQ